MSFKSGFEIRERESQFNTAAFVCTNHYTFGHASDKDDAGCSNEHDF